MATNEETPKRGAAKPTAASPPRVGIHNLAEKIPAVGRYFETVKQERARAAAANQETLERYLREGRIPTSRAFASVSGADFEAAKRNVASASKPLGSTAIPSTQEKARKPAAQSTAKSTAKSSPKLEIQNPITEPSPAKPTPQENQPRLTTSGQNKTQVFDINSFRSEIINNDVLPSHSYLVTFAPFRTGFPENAPLTDFVTNKRNTLMLRCENVVLPTPSLLEEENIRRYGYGPVEKVPYGVQFSDVSMTWLVDSKSEIIEFFHQWMNTIVMHDSPNSLMRGTTVRTGLDQYLPFEVGYKDGYANPIVRIYVYNRQQETVTEYEMYDVFPMNLQSINLSWADENQLQKLTVTFAYTNMQVKAPKKSKIAQANFYEEGRTSPLEERQQPDNRGGRAAADKADSPLGESQKKTINSANPNIQNAVLNVPASTQALPTIRNI
jgi:hypothetical protein